MKITDWYSSHTSDQAVLKIFVLNDGSASMYDIASHLRDEAGRVKAALEIGQAIAAAARVKPAPERVVDALGTVIKPGDLVAVMLECQVVDRA